MAVGSPPYGIQNGTIGNLKLSDLSATSISNATISYNRNFHQPTTMEAMDMSSVILETVIKSVLSSLQERVNEAQDAAVEEAAEEGEDSPAFREYFGWKSAYDHMSKHMAKEATNILGRLTDDNIEHLTDTARKRLQLRAYDKYDRNGMYRNF